MQRKFLPRKRPNSDTEEHATPRSHDSGKAALRTPYLIRRLVAVSGKTTHGVNFFASSKSIEA